MRTLVFLLLAVAIADAKTFTPCEWAQTLKDNGMDGVGGIGLADWMCLTYQESRYRTNIVGKKNRNGSKDYGIFQINSYYWCSDGGVNYNNGCGITCDELLTDDVSAAITCAKRVVSDPNGVTAWVGWNKYCEGRNNSHYIQNCRLQ